jgi:hypothetical protein
MTLRDLPKLMDGKNEIKLSDIPEPFRKDMQLFLVGHTITKVQDGEPVISKARYQKWLLKLWQTGFSYDVNLKGNA